MNGKIIVRIYYSCC